MIRYKLDDLGWYQFEWLVQSLMKADLGLSVESWGGHKDLGRDAYTRSELKFPDKNVPSPGPFIFQVKFVENANAAGAKIEPVLLGAVSKEVSRILQRQKAERVLQSRNIVKQYDLGHYILVTNALLTPNVRERISEMISEVVPSAEVHLLGGSDICDLLDNHPSLRRSFPQLLSIRDLDELLSQVVNRDILEKSKTAVEIAKDVAEVFVPTLSYFWAWETLREYHFVVLEGPPEVGKTAIAWMVALGQLLNGWQVVVCDEPGEFFGSFRDNDKQIFVCDDAFGRTEYDPARGRKWESQLERVLKRVDATHWFIWTTRKHIFERALRDLDLVGTAHFQKAGRIVDATRLPIRDKALILYRHAKAAGLGDESKRLLKQNLPLIVHAKEFTPERIRRFVHERLPELVKSLKENQLKVEDIEREISEAIRNPTERMRKTFKKLSAAHKWILISLFETGKAEPVEAVARIYALRYPEGREPFYSVLDDLREAFVTIRGSYLDWIHPSYRDLVIEELAADPMLRQRILISITLSGLKVAVSDTSGPEGEKKYLLIGTPSDWKLLGQGCVSLVKSGSSDVATDVLRVLTSAAQNATGSEIYSELSRIIQDVCDAIREQWDANETIFTAGQLRTFCQSSLLSSALPTLPKFDNVWLTVIKRIRSFLPLWEEDKMVDSDLVEEWTRLATIIAENEPRFLRKNEFPTRYIETAQRIVTIMNVESNLERTLDTQDEYNEEIQRGEQFINILSAMQELNLISVEVAEALQTCLDERNDEYSIRASELEPIGPDDDYDYSSSRDEPIDLIEFFRDV